MLKSILLPSLVEALQIILFALMGLGDGVVRPYQSSLDKHLLEFSRYSGMRGVATNCILLRGPFKAVLFLYRPGLTAALGRRGSLLVARQAVVKALS